MVVDLEVQLENKKTHIEIPVEILEYVSLDCPLQGDYTERVNKLLKVRLQFIFFIKNIKIVVITYNRIVIIAIIC